MQEKIIIRMPNWLGDVVMATPLLQSIKEQLPICHLTAMCPSHVAKVLYGNPHLDQIYAFDRKESIGKLVKTLRKQRYTTGLLLTNSLSSAWLFFLARVKNRIGFKNEGRTLLLNQGLRFPKMRGREHLVDTYKRLLDPLGISTTKCRPALFVKPEEKREIEELLSQYGIESSQRVIGINPTAAFGPAKCWLPDRFTELTERLLEDPKNVIVFVGDQQGKELICSITETLPQSRVFNLAGKTDLRQLMALLQRCDAFLTNDSGPMHIAAALKTPLLALFGSTNEIATGPYEHGTIIHKHVPCSPCYKRICPIDFKCMRQISVNEVYRQLKLLFENKSL